MTTSGKTPPEKMALEPPAKRGSRDKFNFFGR